MNLALEVLSGGVRGGTSILYAGLGETVSERAGVVNLGIEGSMLCGALGAYAANATSGNPWIGALAGALAGGALALGDVHGQRLVAGAPELCRFCQSIGHVDAVLSHSDESPAEEVG